MPMLRQAQAKSATDCFWLQGDAMQLPLASNSFDGATISFGIRNVDDPLCGLSEIHRVLRPGGVLAVLEFGQPNGWLFGPLYRWYSRVMIPRLGGWLTGKREAYEYLPRTSAAFPCGKEFLSLMQSAGFRDLSAHPLSLGIAWRYRGVA
jgi:demethylmenaquinone methyltransferase/2-methoxy-6-polyprenyl-1,4-benzoquinol methylase